MTHFSGIFLSGLLILIPGIVLSCSQSSDLSTTALRSQMTALMRLHSYEYLYREILYLGDRQTLLGFIPTRDRQFLFRVDFLVSAGVDLQDEGFSLERTGTTTDPVILLELPQPRIFTVDALEHTIHQYVNQTFGGELRFLEMSDLLTLAAQSIEADALRRGILDQARAEAEILIRSFFASLGYRNVRIAWGTANG